MPPDDDNYAHHGINNLVIKYSEFESNLKLDDSIHKESAFYKMNTLEGVLEDFLLKINKDVEEFDQDDSKLTDEQAKRVIFPPFKRVKFY